MILKKLLSFGIVLLLLLLPACNPSTQGNAIRDKAIEVSSVTLPYEIASLPLLNLTTVDTIEKYQSFADNMNTLIKILNDQNDMFNIPLIPATQEAWEKASKTITEYGPLINNYNEVILAAITYREANTENNLGMFYSASGKFAFETAVIVGAVFYTAAYQVVGIVYRSVGLNRLALACGPCAGTILGQAHWTIRTVLVEGASQGAQTIIDEVSKGYTALGGAEGIRNKTTSFIDDSKNQFDSIKNKLSS